MEGWIDGWMVEGEGEQSLHLFDASMVSVFRERREGRRQEGVEGWFAL